MPGSNEIQCAADIKAKMTELKARFPEGVDYRIVYDTTVFVEESITSVYHTLIEAFILVFIVVLVFLQNWRATSPKASSTESSTTRRTSCVTPSARWSRRWSRR